MTDTPDPKLEEAAFKALDTSKIKEEIASDITPEIERLAEEKAQAIAEIKAKEIANDIVTEKMAELGKRISGAFCRNGPSQHTLHDNGGRLGTHRILL